MKKTLCFIIAAVICVAGCASKDIAPDNQVDLYDARTKKFCVMPFLRGKHHTNTEETINLTFTCPIAQLCFDGNDVKPVAENSLTRITQKILKNRFGDTVVPLAAVTDTYAELTKDTSNDSPRSRAEKLGAALDVDYVIVGTVWRFKERVGGAMSIESPASVAFALYLFDVNNGKKMWAAQFDRTQQALSDNLLNASDFFKQGARWLTAEEFAHFGVKNAFKKFPIPGTTEQPKDRF